MSPTIKKMLLVSKKPKDFFLDPKVNKWFSLIRICAVWGIYANLLPSPNIKTRNAPLFANLPQTGQGLPLSNFEKKKWREMMPRSQCLQWQGHFLDRTLNFFILLKDRKVIHFPPFLFFFFTWSLTFWLSIKLSKTMKKRKKYVRNGQARGLCGFFSCSDLKCVHQGGRNE